MSAAVSVVGAVKSPGRLRRRLPHGSHAHGYGYGYGSKREFFHLERGLRQVYDLKMKTLHGRQVL